MTKKELLLTLLTKLKPHRPLAEGFFLVVEGSDDKVLINQLLDLIYQAMKETIKQDGNKQLQKSLTVIDHIRKQEQSEKMSNEELDKLLDIL